jgi:glycine hydroxymethyltransferase
MDEIAACIHLVLPAIGTPDEAAALAGTRTRVATLMGRFPLPYVL